MFSVNAVEPPTLAAILQAAVPLLVTVVDSVELVPVLTLPKASEGGATEKSHASGCGSTPVPVRPTLTSCGLLASLLFRLRLPESAPAIAGEKFTETSADEFGATVTGVAEVSVNWPVAEATVASMLHVKSPLLVTVVVSDAVVPVVTSPKASVVGDAVKLHWGCATP